MHSFTSALIAAALATLISAAPLNLPAGNTGSVSSVRLPANVVHGIPAGSLLPAGQVNSVEGKVESVAGGLHVRGAEIADAVKHIQSEVSKIHTRADKPSVAVIFSGFSTQTQPYVDQLTSMTPADVDITQINTIVASIKAPIAAAIPQLQALVGQEVKVILKAADGEVELSVSEVASLVAVEVNSVLKAVGSILKATNAKGGAIVSVVKGTVTDLVGTVLQLVDVVDDVVDGVASSLGPLIETAESVVSDLGLSL